MKNKRKLEAGETAFTWMMLMFSIFVLIMAYRISGLSSVSSPGAFPMLAAVIMVGSIVVLLLDNRKATKPDSDGVVEELRMAAQDIFHPVFLIYTAIIILYMILLQPLHFIPSSFCFLLGSIILLKGSTPVKSLLITVVLLASIYVIFHYLFRVVLP